MHFGELEAQGIYTVSVSRREVVTPFARFGRFVGSLCADTP